MNHGISRRGFVAGMGAATLASILPKRARAQQMETPHVVLVFLNGGYNALHCSADSFIGSGAFGVTQSNVVQVGQSNLFLDATTMGALPPVALANIASIGVRHGISGHTTAVMSMWNDGPDSYPLRLAAAIPSMSAIRCAAVGKEAPPGKNALTQGVSLQRITDVSAALTIFGQTDALGTDRTIASAALASARAMSQTCIARSPERFSLLSDGYTTAQSALLIAPQTFDAPGLSSAYGLQAADDYRSFRWKMMMSELMIQAGTSVTTVIDNGWDAHGDNDGSSVRAMFTSRILQPLSTFVSRTLAMTGRNVVTVVMGDFSRSFPGSNHQPNLTASVIGKYVQIGTTGRVSAQVALPMGTPSIKEFWAYVAAAAKVSGSPFGANPHGLIV